MRWADHVRPLRQHDRSILRALDTDQVVHAEEVKQPTQLGLIDLDDLDSGLGQGFHLLPYDGVGRLPHTPDPSASPPFEWPGTWLGPSRGRAERSPRSGPSDSVTESDGQEVERPGDEKRPHHQAAGAEGDKCRHLVLPSKPVGPDRPCDPPLQGSPAPALATEPGLMAGVPPRPGAGPSPPRTREGLRHLLRSRCVRDWDTSNPQHGHFRR